jgi:hypothetical protein
MVFIIASLAISVITVLFAGTPLIAPDQSALASAAQRSLAHQAGRQFADAEDDSTEVVQLSAVARNIKAAMLSVFGDELPVDLPSWELLSSMSAPDCMSIIQAKIDRGKEVAGECSDMDAFQKATTPVLYNTPQTDDRLTKIHTASLIRAPLSEPIVWWPLMQKKHSPAVTFMPEGAVGMDCGLSDVAIKKMSDRTVALQVGLFAGNS